MKRYDDCFQTSRRNSADPCHRLQAQKGCLIILDLRGAPAYLMAMNLGLRHDMSGSVCRTLLPTEPLSPTLPSSLLQSNTLQQLLSGSAGTLKLQEHILAFRQGREGGSILRFGW